MDRFVSNFTLRLDAKGRVSIPASYRAVLARDGFDGLYCYPALDQPAVDAGGDVCCASALVNASALTAAAAMTCFNISASWGDLCKGTSVASSRRRPALPTRE